MVARQVTKLDGGGPWGQGVVGKNHDKGVGQDRVDRWESAREAAAHQQPAAREHGAVVELEMTHLRAAAGGAGEWSWSWR